MRPLLLGLSLLLMSCGSTIDDYGNTGPAFELDRFFNGELVAYGLVQDRSGQVLRRFRVDMVGRWEGNKGVLEEDFRYDDGKTQRRVWNLKKGADGHYSGTAADVLEPAAGRVRGFALNWRYTLAVPVDGEVWALDFNDWMYLLDEDRLINRAEMSKWGFRVGEVTLWIERKGEDRRRTQNSGLEISSRDREKLGANTARK